MNQPKQLKAMCPIIPAQATIATSNILNTNMRIDKIQVSDITIDRKIECVDSTSQRFSGNNEFVEISDKGIFSSINDNNALILLETIKNLLIKNNYFTEEEFAKEYNNIQQDISLRIDGYKVANKLTEN